MIIIIMITVISIPNILHVIMLPRDFSMVHVIPGWSRESVGTGRVASRGLSGSQPKDPDTPCERPLKRTPGCLGYIPSLKLT